MKGGIIIKKRITHTKRKELNLLILISVLSLALLTVSPVYCSNSNNSSSSQTGSVLKLVPASGTGGTGFSKLALVPEENSDPLQKFGQYVDVLYILGGFGVALLILLMYRHMASKEKELIENPPQAPYLHEKSKRVGFEERNQEKYEARKTRIYIAVPVICIGLAEFLIYASRTNPVLMELAIGIHIGVLIALSLSNIIVKDVKVYRVYQALMLLPILRLVNLSMPVFSSTTLYSFIFVYAPLLVPLAIIIFHQQNPFDKIGVTTKNLLPYMVLAIPLGFLLGLGEYLTIRPQYLIPNLSIENMLKLTFIMIFFVGLTEELIFRSILQTRLEQALGAKEALIIAGLLFGFMHSGYGTLYEVLYTGFVGLFMGFAFYKTRSLPFVVVMHGLVNVFLFGIFPYYLSGWTIFTLLKLI